MNDSEIHRPFRMVCGTRAEFGDSEIGISSPVLGCIFRGKSVYSGTFLSLLLELCFPMSPEN